MTTNQKRPLVFIATPCFGGLVSQHYMLSVLGLMHHAAQVGFDATLALLGHDALITRGRNTLVSQFLAVPDATHILFIDADIRFEAQQVTSMLQFNQDVVAGIYPLKVINWNAQGVARAESGEALETAPLEYVGSLCEGAELERRGRFATGIWCGGGFMLIKREAILKLIAAYPEARYKKVHAFGNAAAEENHLLFDCMIDKQTGVYISEDFGFCQKWRDIGGKVWLDTEGQLTHIGLYNFIGDPKLRFGPK
ncbi:MAG: hypothetical protein ABSA13_02400 [Beijerinckiaceae bacterium]|jgi:hypothetical protein